MSFPFMFINLISGFYVNFLCNSRTILYLSALRSAPIFSKRSIHIHDGNAFVRYNVAEQNTHTYTRTVDLVSRCFAAYRLLQRQPILYYPTRASTINLFITFLYPFPFYWMRRTQNDAIIDKCFCVVYFHPRDVGVIGLGVGRRVTFTFYNNSSMCLSRMYRMQTAYSLI